MEDVMPSPCGTRQNGK